MPGKPKAPIAELGKFRLFPPYGKYTAYRIEWYDNDKGQTVGVSTRETDLQLAEEAFARYHLTHTPGNEVLKDEPAAQALSRYYLKRASLLASAQTALTAMNSANEVFKDKLVSQIDANLQLEWIEQLRARGVSDATITRWLGVVFAAFNYAATFKHIDKAKVPPRLTKKLWGQRTTARKHKSGDASRRQLTLQELGALCDAAQHSLSGLRYFILALGTGARPTALVKLTIGQYDAAHGVLDLNPPGREQNAKYHPRIAVAPILGQWLASWGPRSPQGHYLGRRADQPLESKNFFKKYIARAQVRDCVPYTLRHTVSSWLAGHGVPKWERSRFMGHSRPDGNTTDDYSHYDPIYLRAAAAAVQKLFEAVAPYTQVDLMRHVWDDQEPVEEVHSQWVDRFLTSDGPRLLSPQPPPPRASMRATTPGEGSDPNPVSGGSRAASDPLNRAFPGAESGAAWHERGTALSGALVEVEETPLKSTVFDVGRLGLEPRTNTLKGTQEHEN